MSLQSNRRRFMAALAALAACPSSHAKVEVRLKKSPYEDLLRFIEPGHDEFPLEREAFEIASRLKRLTEVRALPLADKFRGISPQPKQYIDIAPGVRKAEFDAANTDFSGGLQRWLDSVGVIRSARFFVLPENTIRYEIASGNQYRVGLWKQMWKDAKLVHFTPLEEIVTTAPAPLFHDITVHSFGGVDSFERQLLPGVPYWRTRLDAATGIDVHGANGIACGDIDGDGLDEIYVCQPGGLPNRLYKNRGDATFTDITEQAGVGVLDSTSSALFVDFRNTGTQDLIVLRPDGPLLFLNRGNGTFVIKPHAFRFRNPPQGSFTGMAAADFDRDGRVDLYLCTYQFFRNEGEYRFPVPFHDAQNGPANFLFRNTGDGSFEDVTESVGLNHNNNRYSFAPAWCDYNRDGWPDLYVANDFGRNNLYRNVDGKFRDVAAEAGVEDIGQGMSASWFDYDGDGRLDLYVSNMWTDAGQRINTQKNFDPREAYRRHAKGNSLYRNRGDGGFEETGSAENVEMGRWAWSSDGIDFDNDGTLEILVTAGMVTNSSETDLASFFWRKVAAASPVNAEPSSIYENGWSALTQATHEEYSLAGREPNVFYVRRNGRYYDFSGVSGLDFAEDSRAFTVTDLDGDGNLDLVVKSRLGPQLRVFRNNCAGAAKSLAIRLRGVKSNRDAIGAIIEIDGQIRHLQCGSGYLSQHTKTLHFGLAESAVARSVRIEWPSGARQEFRDLAAGFRYDIEEGSDELRRMPFRARGEIRHYKLRGDNQPRFSDTWFVDPVPLPEPVRGPGFLHLANPLTADRATLYTLFCRYLFDHRAALQLPLWLLVDAEGRAHKIYFAPPDPADLDRMRASDRIKLALPFAGRYFTPPKRNWAALGSAFFAAGYLDQALPYFERAPKDDPKILFATGQIHLSGERLDLARQFFERGLKLAPEAPEGWNNLGGVEMTARNYAKALAHYQKAVQLRPAMTQAMFNAGQAHAALRDTAAAEKMFRRVLDLAPGDPDAANGLGELFVAQSRDGEARTWFMKAITSRRDYAAAINNLGTLYARIGQTNDAIAAFQYGIEVTPDNEAIYLNLSQLHAGMGYIERAREVIERLLARKPDSTTARQRLHELENR